MGTCGMSTWCADQVKKSFVLLLWGATCGVLFWRTYTYYKYDPSFYYVHQILGSFLCISRGSAAVLNLNCGMMLIPISRTFITLIRYCNAKIKLRTIRIMVDSCKGFHIACAYVIVFCSVIHTAGHVFNAKNFGTYYTSSYPNLNGAHYKEEEPILVALSSVPGITGVLMVLVLFLIYTSSASVVRSCNYDVFWYCHKLFAIFYLLFIVHAIQGPIKKQLNLLRHTPGCNYANVTMDIAWPEGGMAEAEPEAEILAGLSYRCDEGPQFDHIGCESWMWVAGPLVFYMTDMLWRMFRRWPRTSILNVTSLPEGVLELQLEKECFTARPGQFVLLQCPRVSEFEWHPYSITQCPSSTSLSFTVHLRDMGDWSGDYVEKFINYYKSYQQKEAWKIAKRHGQTACCEWMGLSAVPWKT